MKEASRGGRVAVLVVAAVLLAVPSGAAATAGSEVKVAVAPLEVHASDGTIASTASEVRRALVDRIGREEGLSVTESPKGRDVTLTALSVPALKTAAREANARYVLYGSLSQLGSTYSLDARLYDASGGRATATFFREGAGREDLLAKIGSLAGDVKRSVTGPARGADTGQGQVSPAEADTSSAGERGDPGPGGQLGLRVGDNKKPIAITSDSLEALNKQNTVVFRGNVEARQGDLQIFCDRMTVLYSTDGKGIVRIVADRNVRIIHAPPPKGGQRQEKITARCARGVYYNSAGKIVLTGDPVVNRGTDTVRGDEITVFFEENRLTVRQAKVTITPAGARSLDQRGASKSAPAPRSD